MSAWRMYHLQAGLAKASLGTTTVIRFLRYIKGSPNWESEPETCQTYDGRRLTLQRKLRGLKQKEALQCRTLPAVNNFNPEGLQRNWNAPFTLYISTLNMARDRESWASLRFQAISICTPTIYTDCTAQRQNKLLQSMYFMGWWLSSPDYVCWP